MWVFLFLVALAVGANANASFNEDTIGTEFIIGFPQRTVGPDNITLLLTSKENVIVEVSSRLFPATQYIVIANQTTVIPLPPIVEVTLSNEVEDKGILVRSFFPHYIPFSLIGFNEEGFDEANDTQSSAGGFLGIPTKALGKVYRALSFTAINSDDRLSEILIVGTRDNTAVEITTTVTIPDFPALVPRTIYLNRLQTFQLQAGEFLDLTGTLVVASKPVAFFAGGNCLEVPQPVSGCDHLVEMLPSIDNFGTKFLIVPFQGRTAGDIVRVVATEPNTQIHINGVFTTTIQEFQFFEFTSSSFAGTYIYTNKPVLVGQYAQGRDADAGRDLDPLETYIPSKEQYLSHYLFSVPANYTSFVNIAIKGGEVANLRLDGVLLLPVFTPIEGTNYVFAQIPITAGSHRLKAEIPFLAIVYGASEAAENDTNVGAYGYPAGMALVGDDHGTQTQTGTRSTQTATRNTHNAETKTAQTSQSHPQTSWQPQTSHQTSNAKASETKTSFRTRTEAPLEEKTQSENPVSSTTTLLPLSLLTALACFTLMN